MPIQRYKPEQIVTMLRQIEVGIANGETSPQACKEAEITIQTFYRWRSGSVLHRQLCPVRKEKKKGKPHHDFGNRHIRHKRSRRDILPQNQSTFVMWRVHLDVPKSDLILDIVCGTCRKRGQLTLPPPILTQTRLRRDLFASS